MLSSLLPTWVGQVLGYCALIGAVGFVLWMVNANGRKMRYQAPKPPKLTKEQKTRVDRGQLMTFDQ